MSSDTKSASEYRERIFFYDSHNERKKIYSVIVRYGSSGYQILYKNTGITTPIRHFKNMFLLPQILNFIEECIFMFKISKNTNHYWSVRKTKVDKKLQRRKEIDVVCNWMNVNKLTYFFEFVYTLAKKSNIFSCMYFTCDLACFSVGLLNYNFSPSKIAKLTNDGDTIESYVALKLEIYKQKFAKQLKTTEALAWFELYKGITLDTLNASKFPLFDRTALIVSMAPFIVR